MGLRELKAARTRQQLVDTAIDLFIEQGYDQTTMEQIAERAEVGTSTLYRYFPSKELLALDRFTRFIDMARILRQRPADEELSLALGEVIHFALRDLEVDDGRFADLRRIVDNAPVPRARLWDLAAQARAELQAAIGERLDRPADDLLVVMTANISFAVFTIAAERWWAGDHSASRTAIVDEVLTTLATIDLILPASSR